MNDYDKRRLEDEKRRLEDENRKLKQDLDDERRKRREAEEKLERIRRESRWPVKQLSTLAVLLAFSLVTTAQASCDEEDIDTIGDNGGIIILKDGSVWKSLDPITSSLWLSLDTVLVCDNDKMINKDEDGETIDVVRLH
jgi:hypothetical protein